MGCSQSNEQTNANRTQPQNNQKQREENIEGSVGRVNLPPLNTMEMQSLNKTQYEHLKINATKEKKGICFVFGKLLDRMLKAVHRKFENFPNDYCYIVVDPKTCMDCCLEDVPQGSDFEHPIIKGYYKERLRFYSFGMNEKEKYSQLQSKLRDFESFIMDDKVYGFNRDERDVKIDEVKPQDNDGLPELNTEKTFELTKEQYNKLKIKATNHDHGIIFVFGKLLKRMQKAVKLKNDNFPLDCSFIIVDPNSCMDCCLEDLPKDEVEHPIVKGYYKGKLIFYSFGMNEKEKYSQLQSKLRDFEFVIMDDKRYGEGRAKEEEVKNDEEVEEMDEEI